MEKLPKSIARRFVAWHLGKRNKSMKVKYEVYGQCFLFFLILKKKKCNTDFCFLKIQFYGQIRHIILTTTVATVNMVQRTT